MYRQLNNDQTAYDCHIQAGVVKTTLQYAQHCVPSSYGYHFRYLIIKPVQNCMDSMRTSVYPPCTAINCITFNMMEHLTAFTQSCVSRVVAVHNHAELPTTWRQQHSDNAVLGDHTVWSGSGPCDALTHFNRSLWRLLHGAHASYVRSRKCTVVIGCGYTVQENNHNVNTRLVHNDDPVDTVLSHTCLQICAVLYGFRNCAQPQQNHPHVRRV